MPESADPVLPLFYRKPVALSSQLHADWRLRDGDMAFAAQAAAVPIVVGEFANAGRDYPILFADGSAAPVALLGLDQHNLFVADGKWAENVHVPAYVRRYPFSTVRDGKGAFVLVLDADSERIVEGEGEGEGEGAAPLFAEGKPSEMLDRVVAFCDWFHADALVTEVFSAALIEQGLLVGRNADITLADGDKLRIDGFRIVDEARFRALPEQIVRDWHIRGWLGLVHFHLASLARFESLLARRSGLSPASDDRGG